MSKGIRPTTKRSPKAGTPPATAPTTRRGKRRGKTARAAVSKGTTLKAAPVGPRAAFSGSRPSWKKR
jgi:hypothetical protein